MKQLHEIAEARYRNGAPAMSETERYYNRDAEVAATVSIAKSLATIADGVGMHLAFQRFIAAREAMNAGLINESEFVTAWYTYRAACNGTLDSAPVEWAEVMTEAK